MAPNQPERSAEIPEDGQRNPEQQKQWLSLVDLLPSRVRALVLIAMLGGGTLATQPGCGWGEEAVDTASDPVLLSTVRGTLDAKLYRTGEAEVTNEHGNTLYHFLKGELNERGKMEGLTGAEQQNLIDVMIHFCAELNPAENLDEFSSIKGKTLIFPETMYLSTGEYSWLLDMGFDSRLDKDEELADQDSNLEKSVSLTEMNARLRIVVDAMAKASEQKDPQKAETQMKDFNALMQRVGVDRFHTILKHYAHAATDKELAPYADQTATQIQDQIDASPGRDLLVPTLMKVRNAKMYQELIAIISQMSPDQVRTHRIFKLTVFDSPGKEGFYDLKKIWEWKKKNKSEMDEAFLYDHVLAEIDKKDNTVSMSNWVEKQSAAINYFQTHADVLGYSGDHVKYITLPVVLAVIHAEFFSDLSGKTFCDVVPYAIESVNLPYGPAVNDKEFSAGVVQMIRDTFRTLLDDNAVVTKNDKGEVVSDVRNVDRLMEMQKKGPSYKIVVPTYTMNGRARSYDAKTFTQAMTSDLDSNLFFAVVAIANHIELAFDKLNADPQFKAAWGKASEVDRYLFVGSMAPLAINGGRSGAGTTADRLLEKINTENIHDYVRALPDVAKGANRIRGAKVGARTMHELLKRAEFVREGQFEPAPAAPTAEAPKRIRVLTAYSIMRDRAISEGFPLSTTPEANRPIYTASKFRGIPIPETGEGYARKSGPESEAIMDADALKIFQNFAKEFKERTGYSLTFTDALRTPEIQAKESPIMDSTHFTGRTLDIADGRFWDANGNEITWTDFSGKKPKRGPNADLIENTLRPAMITLLEEYQARGLMMAFDETKRGGHWHIYIPKTYRGPVESF